MSVLMLDTKDVPKLCPECEADGTTHAYFDANCPAAWAHSVIYEANARRQPTEKPASGERR
jgi:hypothetical protein